MSARRHMDRRALFATGAAAALLAATGLSAQPGPSHGGRLRIALAGAGRTDSFDTRSKQGLFMQVAMAGAVFDTLTEVSADGTLRGELATGWRGSPDALNWTFDLRPDVRFHNGWSFSAEDVVASLHLHLGGDLSDVVSIDSQGSHRVRVTLASPDAGLPYRLSAPNLVVYPAAGMAEAMEAGIGTGLYRNRRFIPGRQFVGERVERHYKDGRAGWFDSVELVSIPAGEVRAQALIEGYVDAAQIDDASRLGSADFVLLPDPAQVTHAARRGLHLPAQIGARWPLDNLRAAERWWMG